VKTYVIAQLPTGSAAATFDGQDWLEQARYRWPDATEYKGTPLCPVCGRGEHAHGGTSRRVEWCEKFREGIARGPFTLRDTTFHVASDPAELQRVVREAIEAEREACAKIAEAKRAELFASASGGLGTHAADDIAVAIRARGAK
jgi:hypothetical protein